MGADCGGEDSGDPVNGTPDGGVISGDTGRVASFIASSIPGVRTAAGANVIPDLRNLAAGSTMLKLHSSPALDDWSQNDFDEVIGSFAPVRPASEGDREISFYWVGGLPDGSDSTWGMFNSNTGTPSFTYTDDLGILQVATSSPLSPLRRPWVLSSEGDGVGVREDDGTRSSSRAVSDVFGPPAEPLLTGSLQDLGFAIAASHPSQPELYVGAGQRLYLYDGSERVDEWSLASFGSGPFNRSSPPASRSGSATASASCGCATAR